ncbi:MAG: secretin and TonB N-terminal domain-containing protein [Bacillota bacterium]
MIHLQCKLLKSLVLTFLILVGLASNLWAQTNLISIDFKTTDIKDVLRALANQEGVNIAIDNQVSGNITIQLNKVTFQQALDLITANHDLTYTKTANLYRVIPVDHSLLNLEFADGLLSLEAREVPLTKLIRELAQKTGANLIPAPELQEQITLTIRKVALPEAIQALLVHANCMAETVGPIRFIRKKTTPPLSFTVNCANNRLTVDAKNIPLAALCRAISEKSGVTVSPDQNLNTNVSIFLHDVPVDDGLNLLCATNGLQLFQEGQARRITKKNGAYRIVAQNNRLSVDADNVDIAIITNEIARQTKTNVTLDREIRGNISAHFQNLPLSQGLAMLVENQGWVVDKQANQYCVRVNPNRNKNIRVAYNPDSQLFDLDIQNAPLATVISEMARRANINIAILAQVNSNVNKLRLQNLEFTAALDLLFEGTTFSYKMVGNVYVIGDGLQLRPENKRFAVVKIYPLKYIKAEQLLNSLPAIYPKQNITLMTEKNALIMTAPQAIQDSFAAYLEQVDIANIEDRTEVIKIKYLKAEEMLKLIPASLPKSDLIVVKEANAIVVTGPQNIINQVKSYIEKIDQINPMIVFDITVIQITNSNSVTWKAPSGSLTLSNDKKLALSLEDPSIKLIKPATKDNDSDSDQTIAGLTALISKGQAKIIANPTITTLNGYQASFNVDTKYNYSVVTSVDSDGTKTSTVKTYDSGLYFTITPWVSMNNQITMEIKPKISQFGDSPEGSTLPSTTERATETTVRVNDGQTVIISGLKNTRRQVSSSKIPILGDIPLLGYLFKNKNVTETQDEFVIVIKPSLVFDAVEQEKINRQITEKMETKTRSELSPKSMQKKSNKEQ